MDLKDWVDVIFKSSATIGGLIAAFRAIREMRENRIQRQRELRWKQSVAAKQIIDELMEDEYAEAVTVMIDWDNRIFAVPKDKEFTITYNDIRTALSSTDKDTEFDKDKKSYIRDAFDHFLYYIEWIEQSILNKLFEFSDVRFPTKYFVESLNEKKLKEPLKEFIKEYNYHNAQNFFNRYPEWN